MDAPTPPRPTVAPGGRLGEKSASMWGPTAALRGYLARPQGLCSLHCPPGCCRQWACRPPLWSHCGHSLREAGGKGRQVRGLDRREKGDRGPPSLNKICIHVPHGWQGWRAGVPHAPAETGRPGTVRAGPGLGSDSGQCGVQGKVLAASGFRSLPDLGRSVGEGSSAAHPSLTLYCSQMLTEFIGTCHGVKLLRASFL